MEETMYDKLLQLPLFQGICKNDFTTILEKVKLHFHKYTPNTSIVKQGTTCKQLIFILSGSVQSESADSRHSYTIEETFTGPHVIEPYSLFGMHTSYTASYKALTEVTALIIDKSYVVAQLNNYEIFRLNYLNILSNRAQTIYNKLWNAHIGNTRNKIINFLLLRCASQTGPKTLYIKMEVLAELIDDTRINVSKVLNEFQQQGLAELSRKKIIIPELKPLAAEYENSFTLHSLTKE